ncbi:MAG: hypothetical protein P4L31_07355 [Candidatus Babeliales bacterium]|nr:hypothetical protein [Candidatus Babeliales bacterium]
MKKLKILRKLKKHIKKTIAQNEIYHSMAYSFNIPTELRFVDDIELGKIGTKIGFPPSTANGSFQTLG